MGPRFQSLPSLYPAFFLNLPSSRTSSPRLANQFGPFPPHSPRRLLVLPSPISPAKPDLSLRCFFCSRDPAVVPVDRRFAILSPTLLFFFLSRLHYEVSLFPCSSPFRFPCSVSVCWIPQTSVSDPFPTNQFLLQLLLDSSFSFFLRRR